MNGPANGLRTVEIKAFVPARDMDLSLRFYRDLGFEVPWASDGLAYLHAGDCSFLLQEFHVRQHADNFMMHLLVADVEAWWRQVAQQRLVERYGVRASPPEDRPWKIRDFTLTDPAGVLWRIGQNIGGQQAHAEAQDGPPAFSRASLAGASFEDVDLASARFDDVNLSASAFTNVSLAGAVFRDVDLRGVAITDADLSGMTIDGRLVTALLAARDR